MRVKTGKFVLLLGFWTFLLFLLKESFPKAAYAQSTTTCLANPVCAEALAAELGSGVAPAVAAPTGTGFGASTLSVTTATGATTTTEVAAGVAVVGDLRLSGIVAYYIWDQAQNERAQNKARERYCTVYPGDLTKKAGGQVSRWAGEQNQATTCMWSQAPKFIYGQLGRICAETTCSEAQDVNIQAPAFKHGVRLTCTRAHLLTCFSLTCVSSFTGGQCAGAPYKIYYRGSSSTRYDGTRHEPRVFEGAESTFTGSILGGRAYNYPWNYWNGYHYVLQVLGYGWSQGGQRSSKPQWYTFLGGSGAIDRDYEMYLTRVERLDGQPDNCGSPPPLDWKDWPQAKRDAAVASLNNSDWLEIYAEMELRGFLQKGSDTIQTDSIISTQASIENAVAQECNYQLTWAFSNGSVANAFEEMWQNDPVYPQDVRHIPYSGQ